MATATETDHAAGMPLDEWAETRYPGDDWEMFKLVVSGQFPFVRDELSAIFSRSSEDQENNPVRVVGEYSMGDWKLPVFSILVPGVVEIRLRNNRVDWAVSVKSEEPVTIDLLDLFDPSDKLPLDWSEFEARWVFAPFSVDDQEFSFTVGSDYTLYTFCWMLARQLGIGGNKPT